MSNDVCEELIVEIFSRLPTKSLLRFRSVSKSLYAVIGSPNFIRLHSLRCPKKFTILHLVRSVYMKTMYTIHSEAQMSSYVGTTPIEYPFGDRDSRKIVGSCNGIICVYDREIGAVHLWNPSIRRKVTVHELPSWGHCYARGFGFDPIIDDYKIVWIFKEATFVYTIKMQTWREIASPTAQFEIDTVEPLQCLFNGAMHWIAGQDSSGHCYSYIMRFDVSSEVFSTIDLPEPLWKVNNLTTIKGCLAVISSKDYDDVHSWIWVRNTAAAWSLDFKLDKDIGSTHGDLVFTHYSKGIMVFNPETEVWSRLAYLRNNHFSYILYMIRCLDSLELLDMGTTCDVIEQGSKRKRSC